LPELSIRNNLFEEIALIFKGGIDQIEGNEAPCSKLQGIQAKANKMLSAFLKSGSDDEVNPISGLPRS
jgi:hypothetical protein